MKNNEDEFGKPFFIFLWLAAFVCWRWDRLDVVAFCMFVIGVGLGMNQTRRKLIGRPSFYQQGYQRGVKSAAETWYVNGWNDARADLGLPFDSILGSQRAKQEMSAAGLNEDREDEGR